MVEPKRPAMGSLASLARIRNVLGGPKRDGSGALDNESDRVESFSVTVPLVLYVSPT
jgi:hypothetical protein